MNKDILRVFKQSSSISIIAGPRDSGKSDLFFRIAEDLVFKHKILKEIGSNTRTRNDSRVKLVSYFDALEAWLELPGKKIFGFDELGVIMGRYDFMSKLSKKILGVFQLARKYDAHVIGIAPAGALVNKRMFEHEIIDCFFYKPSKIRKDKVQVFNKVSGASYTLKGVPRTSLKFITKDIASFGLVDPERAKKKFGAMSRTEKAEKLYLLLRNQRDGGTAMHISHVAFKKLLDARVKELGLTIDMLT